MPFEDLHDLDYWEHHIRNDRLIQGPSGPNTDSTVMSSPVFRLYHGDEAAKAVEGN